ncbi:MAG: hypothetical protein V4633_20870 [Pseudomonadota bacterium]
MADAITPASGGTAAASTRIVSRATAEQRVQQAPQQRKIPEAVDARPAPARQTRQVAQAQQEQQARQASEQAFLTRQDLAKAAVQPQEPQPTGVGRNINTTA